MKRFKVNASIPLDKGISKVFFVEAGSWPVALGAAARALRKSDELKRRRVTCLSITLEQVGAAEGTEAPAAADQQPLVMETAPDVSESQG